MVKTKKKEVQKQGLRPSQKAKAEKLRKKQEAKANAKIEKKVVSAMVEQPIKPVEEIKESQTELVLEAPISDNETSSTKTIYVKNAEGDPDTVAEILIQNKIDYTPKVSVVMPVYNVEEYLRQCLDSVINQTLKEIEIICVDDGSTDASLEILKEYAKKDNRITVITQKNAGSGKARNNAIDNSKGEFIAFMDSDDMYPNENTLEHLYSSAIKNNVLICGGSLSQLREGGKIVTDSKEFEDGYSFKKEGIVKYSDYQFDYGYWRFIYNRQFLKENQLYFPDYLRQQDPPFFVKTMAEAKSFYALTEPTYVYRVSYKQISWNERKAVDLFKGIRDCLFYSKQYKLNNLHSKIAKRLNSWTFRTAAATMVDCKNVRQQILQTLNTIDYDILKKENIFLELDDIYNAIIQTQNNDIIVSIIVPCYNVAKYLPRCLDSIINQTFKSMEIICVNDGSNDNTLEILKDYVKRDCRIRIINKENGGLSSARNAGVLEAKGFFINFIDSDDWIDVTTIEKAVTKMSGPVDLVCYGAELVNDGLEENNQNMIIGSQYHKIKIIGEKAASNENILNSTYTVWNKLFKKSIIDKYDIKFAEGRLFEDNDYTIMYMAHCHNIRYLDEYLYYYVQRPNSIMERLRAGQCNKTADNLYIFDNLYKHLEKFDLLKKYQKVIASRFSIHLRAAYKFSPNNLKEEIRILASKLSVTYKKELFWDDIIEKLQKHKYYAIRELNEIIISLTSYPARIKTVNQTIKTLLNQSVKADKIILWLAPEQFPNKEADLPKQLLDLCSKGLTIDWYHDIRSYKKLIPTLKKYPNSIIVTADDDLLYSPTWLKKLYEGYKKYPDDINIHRATKFYYHDKFRVLAGGAYYYKESSVLNKLSGGAGVIYPPYCFYSDVLDEKLFMKLAPTNDDQWFWCQTVLNGKKIRVVDNNEINLHYVEGTQEVGLTNINDHGEKLFWKDFNNLIDYYPQFKDILIEENNRIRKNNECVPYKDDLITWCQRVFNNPFYDIDKPKTYNEKIQWLKLYDSTPIKTRLADKYLVRDWVKERIGEEYLIPLLGVYDKFEDIDFDKLPNQFVIKCNHGSGYNIIVKDKSQLDLQDCKEKVDEWLEENFAFKSGFELHYMNINPKIIIEKYMDDGTGDLRDYKYTCFGGKPEFIWIDSDRHTEHKRNLYDLNWNQLQCKINSHYNTFPSPEKPHCLKEMNQLAAILCEGFSYVRVDFYIINEKIYFGEMTFTSSSGTEDIKPDSFEKYLANKIKLPKQAYNIDTGKYYKIKKTSILKTFLMCPYYLYELKQLNKLKKEKINNIILEQLTKTRIDIKNVGIVKNSTEVTGKNIKVFTPQWFSDSLGVGKTLETSNLFSTIKLRAINSGILKIAFKGQDKKYNNKRIPIWIDYKSIKIDGWEILSKPISVWHDKPYNYEMMVKDGQEITLEIEQQYHEYTEDELKDILLKLNADNDYIQNNFDIIISELKKQLPTIDEKTLSKRKLEKYIKDIASLLTEYRLDIKNFGVESNSLEITSTEGSITEPKWNTNAQGVGKLLQGNAMSNTIQLKAINDGTLRIDFRGQDKRYNGERFPVWIDYKSIKIDGKEILSHPISTWHNRAFKCEFPVSDGQEIIVEIEQQYHQYSKEELIDLLQKLHLDNDFIINNLDKVIDKISTHTLAINNIQNKVA